MTSSERLASVSRNIQDKAALIWNVANSLYGAFKPHEYGLVILPMVIIKRFHDCLLPTHDAVLAEFERKKQFEVKDGFLCAASGYHFYNTSPFTFETLKADPQSIVGENNSLLHSAGRRTIHRGVCPGTGRLIPCRAVRPFARRLS